MFKKSFFYFFIFLERIKRFLFLNLFGYHIVCKHKPSCGFYFFKIIKKEGFIKGFWKSFIRILTCF